MTGRVFYRVDRTYLTNADGHSDRSYDPKPYLIDAEDAVAAAARFVTDEAATPVGGISALPGDKATASATIGKRFFVVFAQRAAESILAELTPSRPAPPAVDE